MTVLDVSSRDAGGNNHGADTFVLNQGANYTVRHPTRYLCRTEWGVARFLLLPPGMTGGNSSSSATAMLSKDASLSMSTQH